MKQIKLSSLTKEEFREILDKDEIAEAERMLSLFGCLKVAYSDFQSKGDGGLEGAIMAVGGLREYLNNKRPDWGAMGLLNPIVEVLETLRALNAGGTSNILKSSSHRISNRKNLTKNELHHRGIVSALVDLLIAQRHCSLERAVSDVARELRLQGMSVGMNESSDLNTIINWRKKASGGNRHSDIDARAYFNTREALGSLAETISIPAYVAIACGIHPPGSKS